MQETEVYFTNEAYASIIMHSLKHSNEDVCGILLGKYDDSVNSDKENESKERKVKCTVMSVVPLFHTHILSPFTDLSFTLVEEYCQDRKEQIVGYYHLSADDSKNVDVKKILMCELIADKLVSNYKNAVICLAQLSKLKEMEGNCFNAFMKFGASEWKKVETVVPLRALHFLKKSISNNGHLNIYDFEDHLNCMNCDFTNPHLFNET